MSARRDLDYFKLLKESRETSASERPANKKIRLAVIGDCATQHLTVLLRVLFSRHGLDADIYEGAFDAAEGEARNPRSGLYRHDPEVVIVLNTVQALRDKFYQRSGSAGDFRDETVSRLTGVWDALRAHTQATVLQTTLVAPFERLFGQYDRQVPGSLSTIVSDVNAAIVSEARSRNLLLVDLEEVASWVGRRSWFDERLWAIAKLPTAMEHLPLVAQGIVDVTLATKGRAVKCVVLDLDNTLWGGVVGDDGPHGIKIAAHGDGEAFHRFQCFLKELKNRGILLAVCSKNEHENAVRPFEINSEMVLKLDDITVFVANWENKPQNIASIRDALNIGLDSMLFLDDNPFERAAVRTLLPDVMVPELPDDPADYVKTLVELNLFETTAFSAEDAQRSTLYRQEAQRRLAETTAPSFEDYLQSLEMTIEVTRFTPEQLGRITQLLQRSNQFNLTTQRHNQAQCEAMMNDIEGCLPLTASLRDRFGDHGLISIVVVRPDRAANTAVISDWLMSCRVLTRGVEEYLMNHVVEQARRWGLSSVAASYIPTSKNAMVKDFYTRFDFRKTVEHADGRIDWVLPVAEYTPRGVFIRAAEGR
ncbi:MAG TPA: HAD-IIIC family phosphatase [Methylomirabilota bacterium]|jgi:FkbH-like protein|nr:HAD-IIIC family phosphatase [Methylomirabilota bacterium]